jgi:squalene cyclase
MKEKVITLLAWLLCLLPLPAQELFIDSADPLANEVERLYVNGIQYLARAQQPEGHWADPLYGSEPAVVGLAMVAILAHGDDPNLGPYAINIRRAIDFILRNQNKDTGYIGRSMYNHGFATLALAEAYGAVQDERLGKALEKAVKLIVTSQRNNPLGGWRYSPESTDADTTVSGAQMVALFAARNAGIPVPEESIQRGLGFFQKSQMPDGGFSYTPGTPSNPARTAIGCVVFALAKEKTSVIFQNAFKYLQRTAGDNNYRQYFLYYGAQAYFHASPDAWQTWNRNNIRELARDQAANGSWPGQFGETFATSASLLSMALNYRFLPIYER